MKIVNTSATDWLETTLQGMTIVQKVGHVVMAFWRGFWVDQPGKVVFTSFGNPSAFYEFPHFPNMIAAWGLSPASQAAAVKVWLGEIEATGRCPVTIPYICEAFQDTVQRSSSQEKRQNTP